MSTQDPTAAALFFAAGVILKEASSRAKRVPTDWRERRGYRMALRWASRQLVFLATAAEAAAVVREDMARAARERVTG